MTAASRSLATALWRARLRAACSVRPTPPVGTRPSRISGGDHFGALLQLAAARSGKWRPCVRDHEKAPALHLARKGKDELEMKTKEMTLKTLANSGRRRAPVASFEAGSGAKIKKGRHFFFLRPIPAANAAARQASRVRPGSSSVLRSTFSVPPAVRAREGLAPFHDRGRLGVVCPTRRPQSR